MTTVYRLNPFAVISETQQRFVLGASSRLQMMFAKDQKNFIELLLTGREWSLVELQRYIAPNRIEEMLRKHILLNDRVPPLSGRYSRQFGFFSLLAGNFEACHDKISQADVLLLGGGAIGSHVLWNLAAMGVARITVVDFDVVEDTNLNRQLLYSADDVGQTKVDVLRRKIQQFNPTVEVTAINQRICGPQDVERLIPGKTLVVKAIDTPEQSTEWVNAVCVKHAVPFITGGFLDDVGVVGPAYLPGESVCFACYGPHQLRRLHGAGATFAPLTGIVSSMIAMCAFRIIAGVPGVLANKLYTYDTFGDTWETVPLRASRPCAVCGRAPDKAPPPPAQNAIQGIWFYRAAIVTLMLLVCVLRSATHDRYAGLVVLCALFLSTPALDLLAGKKPEVTRREMFLTSCLYSLLALLIVGLQGGLTNLQWPSGSGLQMVFGAVEQASLLVMEAVIAITCLFLLLNAFMYAVKTAAREQEKWIS